MPPKTVSGNDYLGANFRWRSDDEDLLENPGNFDY
jgi:hypothetical protein